MKIKEAQDFQTSLKAVPNENKRWNENKHILHIYDVHTYNMFIKAVYLENPLK